MKNPFTTTNLTSIRSLLRESAPKTSHLKSIFYKTGPGHYAEHDQFIGVSIPALRQIAKDFSTLTTEEIQNLIESRVNEERLLALLILALQYQKAETLLKDELYRFYLRNLKHVNNWNLVDASAHLIIGAHLVNSDKEVLFTLAQSESMWERRIAIVSTWYLIRQNDLAWTFKIAEQLLNDTHDLIHKAVGWMLREAGKKDEKQLATFLNQHAKRMPRTMLRYAIERFPESQRKLFLQR